MAAEDKQIQVWAKPVGHKPRLVFGSRCVGGEPTRWNLWSGDGRPLPSAWHPSRRVFDALDEWSADGEDRLWDEVEVLAAPVATVVKLLQQESAAWDYEERWWWYNWGPDEGQIGGAESLRNVSRVDAVESLRRFLRDPLRPA